MSYRTTRDASPRLRAAFVLRAYLGTERPRVAYRGVSGGDHVFECRSSGRQYGVDLVTGTVCHFVGVPPVCS